MRSDPLPRSLDELLPGTPRRTQLIVVGIAGAVVLAVVVVALVLFVPWFIDSVLRPIAEWFDDQ